MSDVVEKVARAMCEDYYQESSATEIRKLSDEYWRNWINEAKAAIAALADGELDKNALQAANAMCASVTRLFNRIEGAKMSNKKEAIFRIRQDGYSGKYWTAKRKTGWGKWLAIKTDDASVGWFNTSEEALRGVKVWASSQAEMQYRVLYVTKTPEIITLDLTPNNATDGER